MHGSRVNAVAPYRSTSFTSSGLPSRTTLIVISSPTR